MKLQYFKFIAVLFLAHTLTIDGQNNSSAGDVFDWTQFDPASIIEKDAINFGHLQGNWISTKIISYENSKPGGTTVADKKASLSIRGSSYRKSYTGDAFAFMLDENLIIFKTMTVFDSAYINLITNTKLVLSFKKGQDIEQIYYEK